MGGTSLNLIDLVRAPHPRLILALELALALTIAAQVARLVWIVAAPVAPLSAPVAAGPRPADLGILAQFDAFGVSGGGSASAGNGAGSEGFRLFGVRSGGPGGGSAIIAGPDGVQKSYAIGETLTTGVILATVAADHVELSRGGARSTLSFPDIQ